MNKSIRRTKLKQVTDAPHKRNQNPIQVSLIDCFGKAFISFLSTGFFFGLVWVIEITERAYWDSRAGMVFPIILPLLLIGLVYGGRALHEIRVIYTQVPARVTAVVVGGLVILGSSTLTVENADFRSAEAKL